MTQDLFDAQALARSLYHNTRRQGQDASTPLIILGAITCAIGATMIGKGLARKPFALEEMPGVTRGRR